MNESTLIIDGSHEHIIKVSLNRPQKRNALNVQMLKELAVVLEKLKHNKSVRALILQGQGSIFCSGLDLKEALQPEMHEQSSQMLSEVFSLLYDCNCVTIVAVHGAVIAGGCGLMCACDYAIAESGTQFSFPEVKRGLVPAFVATLLQRQVHPRAMRELFLFGETIDTERALALGLINCIESSINLESVAFAKAEIASKTSPEAIQATKSLLRDLEPRALDKDLKIAMAAHRQARESLAATKGIAAFLNNRDAEAGDK